MKKLQRLLAAILALAMMLAMAGCGSAGGSSSKDSASSGGASSDAGNSSQNGPVDDGEPVYGGNLNCYHDSDIDAYFDPAIGDTVIWNLFLEGLWSYDTTSGFGANSDNVPSSSLKGQLAESWTWDEATAQLTVTLRDDIFFQQLDAQYDYYGGRKLVASDVKWTYDRLCGLGSGYDTPMETESNWAGNLSMLVSVEAPDDRTVVFTLNSGDEVTLENFMIQFVKIGGPEWDTLSDAQKTDYHYACGTGPYMISEFEAGQRVVLTKNENYYAYDERHPENKLPYLDSITFQYIADSTNVVTQFTSGKLDWFGGRRGNLINDSEAAQIAASGAAYYTIDVASAQPEYLAMKSNTEPFSDIRVRQALQLAINMQEVHAAYLGLEGDVQLSGLWNPASTTWSTVDSWDQELLDSFSYNPEKAKQLLADAGYANGFEFTVVMCGDNDYDLWILAQEYWAAIGVTVKFETVDNFMEAKTIGTDANDTRVTASTGAGAVNSITAAINQTVDGGWASSLWNMDETYTGMIRGMQTAKTLDEQTQLALQADQYYADQHWTVNLTGMRLVSEYMNSRVHGVPDGCRLFTGKASNSMFSSLWVSDGQ